MPQVTVYQTDGTSDSASSEIDVSDGTLTATPADIALDVLTAGSVINVGHIPAQDPAEITKNPAAITSDFTVTANWGDEVDDGFVVPTDDGGFDVYATRSSDYAGSNSPMQITVTEDSGQTGSATAPFDGHFALAQWRGPHPRRAAQ